MNTNPLFLRSTLGGRQNLTKGYFMGLITFFYGWHRLLLEVFIRKNFGERYFKFSSAITTALFLSFLPLLINSMQKANHDHGIFAGGLYSQKTEFSPDYIGFITWYAFIGLFLYVSVKHWRAQRPSKSLFDFSKYSIYSGDIDQRFYEWKFSFVKTNIRTIECLFEPAPFFIAGLALALVGQYLGFLLIFSSIVYGFSYLKAYEEADAEMLALIDTTMLNEEFENVFVEGMEASKTRHVEYRGTRPEGVENRRKLLPYMMGQGRVFTAN